MFVVINPSGVVPYASSKDDPVPPCNPFDPAKETIVFVHASAMSSALFSAQVSPGRWSLRSGLALAVLRPALTSIPSQFADPRLARAYNLVGLDARLHGRTTGADLTKKEHTVEVSKVVTELFGCRGGADAVFAGQRGVHYGGFGRARFASVRGTG